MNEELPKTEEFAGTGDDFLLPDSPPCSLSDMTPDETETVAALQIVPFHFAAVEWFLAVGGMVR